MIFPGPENKNHFPWFFKDFSWLREPCPSDKKVAKVGNTQNWANNQEKIGKGVVYFASPFLKLVYFQKSKWYVNSSDH